MKNKDIDLSKIELSFDETYHLYLKKPLYNKKFKKVMSFHSPGVAMVEDDSGAYHIDLNGNPIYTQRYLKAYGYYEGIATVVDEKGYFHIDLQGKKVHNDRFSWAGNFQEGRCVVRDFDGLYYHIKRNREQAYQRRYKYAGDFKYGIAVVYDENGLATHIDKDGNLIHGKYFLELGVYHKGYAIAKDYNGYFHIDKKGRELYLKRFAWVENFYNDYALARCFDGKIVIIDTKGEIKKEIASYHTKSVIEINRRNLMEKLVGYWHTQILYSIVRLGVLEYLKQKEYSKEDIRNKINLPENTFNLIIDYLIVNKMIEYKNRKYDITEIGKLFTENNKKGLKYAALMWGEEHYRTMASVVDALKEGEPQFPKLYGKNFFEYLLNIPEKNEIYQKAMEEYSIDYDNLITHFKIPENVKSIADIGGGHGRLLNKILLKYPNICKAIVFDLPEVVMIVKNEFENHKKIEFISGNFFENIPFKVDAIVISRVLHDWDDEKCIKILTNAKNALKNNGILYVIESIVPEKPDKDCGISLNFNLLVMIGGRERKLTEFTRLFETTGFRIENIFKKANCSPSLIVLRKAIDEFCYFNETCR